MNKKTLGVILAGGKGTRFTQDVPKQFTELRKKPVLAYSLEAMEQTEDIDSICIVAPKDCFDTVKRIIKKYKFNKVIAVIEGGEKRADSVRAALEIAKDYSHIVIHDSARPLLASECVAEVCSELRKGFRAVTAAIPTTDTVAYSIDRDVISKIPDRTTIFNIQTPQGFSVHTLEDAYARFESDADNPVFTDDCGLVLHYFPDVDIKLISGSRALRKLTYPEDLTILETLLKL